MKKKEEMKQTGTIQRIRPTLGNDRVEIVTDEDCEIKYEDGKYFVIRKANRYPKTYSVCFAIMGAKFDRHYFYTKKDKEDNPHEVKILDLLDNLRILLVCRDAYWKIAGDWKPTSKIGLDDVDFSIRYNRPSDTIYKTLPDGRYTLLSFPTAQMRDAFYENFKDLIEKCKELL